MQTTLTCEPSPDTAANEDVALAGEDFVLVLDGATASGLPSGCVHGVRWLTRRLAHALAGELLARPDAELRAALHRAVVAAIAAHPECDPTNPETPSATVAVLRRCGDRLDALVLADSPVVVETADGEVQVLLDDRVEHLPAYDRATVSALRNRPGGFWVAGGVPEAAAEALTASFPLASVSRAAVLSDGVSRLVERYGWSWRDLLDALAADGPARVVAALRALERAAPPGTRGGKRHDDASVAYVLP